MFKRKAKTEEEMSETGAGNRKIRKWLMISIAANVVIVLAIGVFSASAVVVHQSDTNPNFCGSCHVMESHVDSYQNSNYLDNAHAQAGVLCKDCHNYPIPEEIRAGINFLTGNYELDEDGHLPQRDFGDEICTQCHISLEHMALKTDFLYYNPHDTRMGTFSCNTCHISHGEQIDYCSECHENGGQRMLGDTSSRAEQLGVPESHYSGMFDGMFGN